MKLSDLRAQIAEMEEKGEWPGTPENLEQPVVERAADVFRRIADHAASSGATELAAEWIEAAEAYTRIALKMRGGAW